MTINGRNLLVGIQKSIRSGDINKHRIEEVSVGSGINYETSKLLLQGKKYPRSRGERGREKRPLLSDLSLQFIPSPLDDILKNPSLLNSFLLFSFFFFWYFITFFMFLGERRIVLYDEKEKAENWDES